MIEYLPNPSPYFVANKSFCEHIVKELEESNIAYSGSCTSYGYDVFFSVFSNGMEYKINYHRHQSTGNMATTRTRHYALLEILNIPIDEKIQVNRNTWLSAFLWKANRIKLSTHFTLTSTSNLTQDNKTFLLDKFDYLKLITLKLNHKKLEASFWNDKLLPTELVHEFNEILKILA